MSFLMHLNHLLMNLTIKESVPNKGRPHVCLEDCTNYELIVVNSTKALLFYFVLMLFNPLFYFPIFV